MTVIDRDVALALERAIAQRIGEARYALWFAGKTRFSWDGDGLVIGVPNHFYLEWLQNKYGDGVAAAGEATFGATVKVRFTIDPELFQAARQAQEEVARGPGLHDSGSNVVSEKPAAAAEPFRLASDTPARRFRKLDDFVCGSTNRVAHAAALSVVEMPGQSGTPLVLHGPVGTGKTHLLEGIFEGVRRQQPLRKATFVTAEEFTNRFLNQMRQGKLAAFRKQFRASDLLLVDDLHFLARKRATAEEFLHTLDALLSAGRQVVLTCDVHPRLADEFAPELVDRLLGGTVWSLAPPDQATRLAILQAKQHGMHAPIGEEVLLLLAEQIKGNVRELEGALHSLVHLARATCKVLDLTLARDALREHFRHTIRSIKLEDVQQAVLDVLRLPANALQSDQRGWAFSHPRMLAMFLSRKHTSASYNEIGQHYGGRNHSTVVAAEKKVRRWIQERGTLSLDQKQIPVLELIERIERQLQA